MTHNQVPCRTHGGMLLLSLLAAATTAYGQPTVGISFQGSTLNESGFIPPDTMGAIGPPLYTPHSGKPGPSRGHLTYSDEVAGL